MFPLKCKVSLVIFCGFPYAYISSWDLTLIAIRNVFIIFFSFKLYNHKMDKFAILIYLITCVRGQNMKPRISLEFDMPLTELVDTCHSYAEQKGTILSVSPFLFLKSLK